ncbi:hypothetical protein [Ideonella sp. A 288]|uniref:hypothetical protein n=1 Tax=Ideonella sp. A 288 TaxID=1962181 RepID=UPI001F1AD71B|nr:hypothetical protein [Ideonella sp. A 288]
MTEPADPDRRTMMWRTAGALSWLPWAAAACSGGGSAAAPGPASASPEPSTPSEPLPAEPTPAPSPTSPPRAPALLPGTYRNTQPWLFADVQQGTVLRAVTSYVETPARPGIANAEGFNWGATLGAVIGPTHRFVDGAGEWPWLNAGGDWIDVTGRAQSVQSPHGAVAANAVPTGSSVYSIDLTAGVQAAQTGDRWNAYIVRCDGAARALATQHHPTLPAPSIAVTYRDGSTATLACHACVALSAGTSYAQIGASESPVDPSVAIGFDRPTQAVQSAVLTLAVTRHTAAAAQLRLYLANPPTAAPAVLQGVAAGHSLDGGLNGAAGVIVAHDYRDGTALRDWLLPDAINVFDVRRWTPDLWGAGASDDSRLPAADAGQALAGKWVHKSDRSPNISLVDSQHVGDGFAPLAAGLGALRVVTPKSPAADGGVADYTATVGTGADLWLLFPKAISGLLDETYTRFHFRYHAPRKTLAETKMFRASASSTAVHALMGGKFGIGVHHWTPAGGNNNFGGGKHGWTNRLGFVLAPADAPLAGLVPYVHAWDMIGRNFKWGNLQGRGGALYPDRWYCIEIRCKLNTWKPAGGSPSDGIMEVFLDGVKVATHTGWSYRDGPLDHIAALPPQFAASRNLGPIGLLLNCYNGGVLPADEDMVQFYGAMACGTRYIGPLNTGVTLAPSVIRNISANTRADIDPAKDPLSNSRHPALPPWDFTHGTQWLHTPDFCGATFASAMGAQGTYLMYGAAGHSAGGPCVWMGYDVARATWALLGPRPLQTNSLQGFVAGASPPPSQFDHVWGDYNGASADWPPGWQQPGFNPPEGSHTRNSFVYRPPHRAGNRSGQVINAWQPTGGLAGTPYGAGVTLVLLGSHYYDLDTHRWHRTANTRVSYGSLGITYHEPTDCVIGHLCEGSNYGNYVDWLDCATMTWRRVPIGDASPPYILYDSTCFTVGDLYVVALYDHADNPAVPMQLWALSIDAIRVGTKVHWTRMAVSASEWPLNTGPNPASKANMQTTGWALCPLNGRFYALSHTTGSNRLYRLTPPRGSDSEVLTGTWTLDSESFDGGNAQWSATDYSRLQWAPALNAFLWTGEDIRGPVQAIRLGGT